MTRRRIAGLLCVGAALGALAIAWVELAPRELGGKASYVLIDGSSMQPALASDDLAVLRPQGAYGVGDVVAYRSERLDRIVLHRIVATQGDSYVTRGDANGFLDPDRPTPDEIIGELWLTVPYGGTVLGWLRAPLHAALLAGGVTLLLLATWLGVGPARRRRARRRREATAPASRPLVPLLYAVLGCVAAGGIALGVAALATSPTETATVADAYRQLGRFGYSADARPGAAYPSGRVESGEPVFLELVRDLDVSFSYRLAASDATGVEGTAGMTAVVASPDGWTRRLVLAPPRPFAGTAVDLSGQVDVGAIQSLLVRLEREIGVAENGVTVTIAPQVTVAGTVAGASFDDSFAPRLAFALDASRLVLVRDAQTGAPSLTRSATGSVARTQPSDVSFLGVGVDVRTARILAGALLAAALGGLAALLAATRPRGPVSEADRIAERYGRVVVPVACGDGPAQRVVEVSTIEALVRLAEAHGTLVLRREDEFHVDAGDTTYRYAAEPAPAATAVALRPGPVAEAR